MTHPRVLQVAVRPVSQMFFVVAAAAALRLLFPPAPSTGETDIWIGLLDGPPRVPLQTLVGAVMLAAGTWLTLRVDLVRLGAQWAAVAILVVTWWLWPAGASEAGFLLYAIVAWAVNRCDRGRAFWHAWLLPILTAAVFTVRAGHGLSVGAAALVALAVRHDREGLKSFSTTAQGYVGSLAVIALAVVPLGDLPGAVGRASDRISESMAVSSRSPASPNADRPVSDPVAAPRFNIRWAEGVDDSQRLAKEREFALTNGQADTEDERGRTWQYDWTDPPPADVRRMLDDPAVEDTHNIDRGAGRYNGTSPSLTDEIFQLTSGWSAMAAGVTGSLTARLRWPWLVVTLFAAFRVARRSFRPATAPRDGRNDLLVLPALMLCGPAVLAAIGHAGNFPLISAPVIPALVVVAAWAFAPRLRPASPADSSTEEDPAGVVQYSARRLPIDLFVYVGLSLFTFFVHLSVNSDITNDHAAYLAMARQILYGDWPIRDFRDDGSLLQILLSAAVQRIGGFRLLGEMALAWSFLAAANCLTYRLSWQLSRSRSAGLMAAVFAALLVPRPYGYPKVFVYPVAILMMWRYIDRPGTGRLVAMAAATALAFLFRIDHGVVVAVASAATLVAVHAPDLTTVARRAASFAGWCLLCALPQAAYVVWTVGVGRYVESILTFGTYALANRQPWPFLFSPGGLLTEANAIVLLLYVFVAIVAAATLSATARAIGAWRRGERADSQAARILTVCVVWVLMLPMILRDSYYTRIAEIGQPVAILGAWAAMRWLASARPPLMRWGGIGTATAAIVIALCLRLPERFFTSPAAVFRAVPLQWSLLKNLATSPPFDASAPPDVEGERWVVRYIHLCTKPDDRVLVTWFGPEVPLYAGRAFAGDRWVYLPFDNSAERQRRIVDRIRSQSVPLVFVNVEQYPRFERSWPVLATYLDSAYVADADIAERPGWTTRVLVRKPLVPARRLPLAGLPCFD